MADALKLALAAGLLAALGGCRADKPSEQNVAIDINDADPSDIEAVPSDETSATPADELANGADNADVRDLNTSTNSD